MFRYWKIFVFGLVLISSIAYAAEIGEKAPDFSLLNLSQKKVNLSDYQGKVIILDFWDTWCSPCRMEIHDFVELQKKWGDKGLQIIGVAFGRQGLSAVKSFAKKYKINYLVLLADGQILEKYGPIRGIPTTFVINREGKIYKKYIGYRPKGIFEEDIKKLVGR